MNTHTHTHAHSHIHNTHAFIHLVTAIQHHYELTQWMLQKLYCYMIYCKNALEMWYYVAGKSSPARPTGKEISTLRMQCIRADELCQLFVHPPPIRSLRGDEGRIGTEVSSNMQDCASDKSVHCHDDVSLCTFLRMTIAHIWSHFLCI